MHTAARLGARLRRRQEGRRDRRARRGDLRRGDGRQDLVRDARARPAAPGRRPAGLAGHGDPGRAGDDHRRAAAADRRARHGRGDRRTASTPGSWSATSCTARRRRPPSAPSRRARAWTSALRAYSDSINDIPMLSLVGRAVAVNPDSALRAEAKERGWEIRDFRTGRKAARVGIPGRSRPRRRRRRGRGRAGRAAPAA